LNKKQDLIKAGIRLFAAQGFDSTTTLQITKEAGLTEPSLYYHFQGKHELFTYILNTTFEKYFARMESLKNETPSRFEKIENLIDMHFQFVYEMPDEIYLAVSTCPARLKDPEDMCAKNIQKQRLWLISFLTDCLDTGIESNEFIKVPIEETVGLLIAMINGLVRQRGLHLENLIGIKETAVEFCRRSLVKNKH